MQTFSLPTILVTCKQSSKVASMYSRIIVAHRLVVQLRWQLSAITWRTRTDACLPHGFWWLVRMHELLSQLQSVVWITCDVIIQVLRFTKSSCVRKAKTVGSCSRPWRVIWCMLWSSAFHHCPLILSGLFHSRGTRVGNVKNIRHMSAVLVWLKHCMIQRFVYATCVSSVHASPCELPSKTFCSLLSNAQTAHTC